MNRWRTPTAALKTSAKGIYICSSSTPPGGAVHGMWLSCSEKGIERCISDLY